MPLTESDIFYANLPELPEGVAIRFASDAEYGRTATWTMRHKGEQYGQLLRLPDEPVTPEFVTETVAQCFESMARTREVIDERTPQETARIDNALQANALGEINDDELERVVSEVNVAVYSRIQGRICAEI